MKDPYKFCTIYIQPGNKEFECTVKTDQRGVEHPKDVWYNGRWVSYNRVMKLESTTGSCDFTAFRDEF